MYRPGPDRLRGVLDRAPHSERPIGVTCAAVAMVFRHGEVGTELLFIQRATREGDPWSGQMAFPGGKYEPGDESWNDTAERETCEELALDLGGAVHLGAMSVLDGGRAVNRMTLIAPICYWLGGERPNLQPNAEVAEAIWVPVGELASPTRRIDYHYPPANAHFPGIQLDAQPQVIWGLTLRFIADLFSRLGYPFEG